MSRNMFHQEMGHFVKHRNTQVKRRLSYFVLYALTEPLTQGEETLNSIQTVGALYSALVHSVQNLHMYSMLRCIYICLNLFIHKMNTYRTLLYIKSSLVS